MDSEWRVRLLRAWFYVRELLGLPKRLTTAEHAVVSDTVLLAGSPWHVYPATTSAGTSTFYVTNTTWPLLEEEDVD